MKGKKAQKAANSLARNPRESRRGEKMRGTPPRKPLISSARRVPGPPSSYAQVRGLNA